MLAALALALPSGARANGVRIVAVGAPPLSSPNVSLVASLPDTGMTGGRFAGGYFFATISSPIPFEAGPNSGVRIFDVRIPEVPLLVGVLPLPHAENEDVDVSVSRKLLLISMDTISERLGRGDYFYVVSWTNPNLPRQIGSLRLPQSVKAADGRNVGGPGHIVNCIADCARYAYITGAGDGSIFVVDLKDPTAPAIAKVLQPRALKPKTRFGKEGIGTVHDVNVEPSGLVWMTGGRGAVLMDAKDPLNPRPLKWMYPHQAQAYNQFIFHNSLRLDRRTVLITEEDWLEPGCGSTEVTVPGEGSFGGGQQGGFQTWAVNGTKGGEGAVKFADQWLTELDQYANGSNPVTVTCSSHWFTFNEHKIVAVGWYNQGVRFLDVSDPKDIRQVGYWLAPGTMASAAYFAPGRNDIVYVTDYVRGFEVLRIQGGGRGAATVTAPLRAEWLGHRAPGGVSVDPFGPSKDWGYACRRLSLL
ncbi:MAG: LVIVD repeat-containing protein [Actinomycetota bacterium]